MTKEAPGGAGKSLPYAVTGKTSITTSTTNAFHLPGLQLTATLTGGDPFTPAASGVPAGNGIVLQFGSLGGPMAAKPLSMTTYSRLLRVPRQQFDCE